MFAAGDWTAQFFWQGISGCSPPAAGRHEPFGELQSAAWGGGELPVPAGPNVRLKNFVGWNILPGQDGVSLSSGFY